jgi:hypothetical protein
MSGGVFGTRRLWHAREFAMLARVSGNPAATPMQAPKINTAIPRQRYQLGDYQAVVLAEIDSPDPARYQYILALVAEGAPHPSLYVIAEKNPRSRKHEGSHCLRVVSEQFSEDMGSSDRYGDLDAFAAEGLRLAAKVLGLGAIEPLRLA